MNLLRTPHLAFFACTSQHPRHTPNDVFCIVRVFAARLLFCAAVSPPIHLACRTAEQFATKHTTIEFTPETVAALHFYHHLNISPICNVTWTSISSPTLGSTVSHSHFTHLSPDYTQVNHETQSEEPNFTLVDPYTIDNFVELSQALTQPAETCDSVLDSYAILHSPELC